MNFKCFKNFLSTLIYLIAFISFSVLIFLTDYKNENFIEYTLLNHTILNIYLGIILFLLLFQSIFTNIFSNFFSENLIFFRKNKYKGIVLLLLAIIHFAAENFNQLLLGMILMCSSLAILIIEIVFDCRILENNNNNINNNNKNNNNNNNNNNNIINDEINKI